MLSYCCVQVTDPPRFGTESLMSWENSQSLENWDSWSPSQAPEWEYNLEFRSWEEVTLASPVRKASASVPTEGSTHGSHWDLLVSSSLGTHFICSPAVGGRLAHRHRRADTDVTDEPFLM